MSRRNRICTALFCVAFPMTQVGVRASETGAVDSKTQSEPIALATVEVIGADASEALSGASLNLVAPQTSDAPIGTGVRPEIKARAHVGDRPNLIPQMRTEPRSAPLGVQPLRDPAPAASSSSYPAKPQEVASFPTSPTQRQTLASPQLRIDSEGPETINVGQETSYKLHITNEGESDLESLVLDVAFSSEIKITKSNIRPEMLKTVYRFPLQDLESGETQTLSLMLLTDDPAPIQLATRISLSSKAAWTLNSAGKSTSNSVKLRVEGPNHVSAGGEADHRLTVVNSGSSPVSDVRILVDVPEHLRLPTGQSSEIEVGTIKAGASRSFVFSTIGVRAGDEPLVYNVIAGDKLVDEFSTQVNVQAEQFVVAITGPNSAALREQTTFGIELSNLSNRNAERLAIQLLLPKGMQVVALDRQASFDADKNLLIWQVDKVDANERIVLRLKTVANRAGSQTLMVQANTSEKVLANEKLTLHVEANRRTSFED